MCWIRLKYVTFIEYFLFFIDKISFKGYHKIKMDKTLKNDATSIDFFFYIEKWINKITWLFFLNEEKPNFFFSIRFLLTFLIFCGIAVTYMQRIDMGIGIVCMVNNTALEPHHKPPIQRYFSNLTNDTCYFKEENSTIKVL